jgi:hypothetical protein
MTGKGCARQIGFLFLFFFAWLAYLDLTTDFHFRLAIAAGACIIYKRALVIYYKITLKKKVAVWLEEHRNG